MIEDRPKALHRWLQNINLKSICVPLLTLTFLWLLPGPDASTAQSECIHVSQNPGATLRTHEAHAAAGGRLVRVDQRQQVLQRLTAPPIDQVRVLLVACAAQLHDDYGCPYAGVLGTAVYYSGWQHDVLSAGRACRQTS